LPEAAPEAPDSSLLAFYRFHAPVYDWTRVFILFGRHEMVRRLDVHVGARVLDVGCGTGWNFGPLLSRGASIVGIECSPHMRERAERRGRRLGGAVRVDPRPYGSHGGYERSADYILFSYSLTMIPPFASVLSRARADLVPGGRIGVVDFLEATNAPTRVWLRANHVVLGRERLELLSRLFPEHTIEVRSAGLWRYFLFLGSTRA
jgi:S-adenosylmethionine-diacylgycerolhomoserine-N-methlytransferase